MPITDPIDELRQRLARLEAEATFAAPHGSADVSELLKDKARLDWLEQGTSEKINSANDFVDWTSGRITRAKIDEAMCPPNKKLTDAGPDAPGLA